MVLFVCVSASEPEDKTQQAKWMCSTPIQAVMEPSTYQPIKMEASDTPIGWRLHLNTQTASTVPNMCHLPNMYEVSSAPWLDLPHSHRAL